VAQRLDFEIQSLRSRGRQRSRSDRLASAKGRHHQHAHDVLMNELADGALPSQKFRANAAGLRLNVIL
jgi:hypothetical protein